MRVLIIDDEEMIGRALERILGKEHEVFVSKSGPEAVARIQRSERFDAILCDVMMPGTGGCAVHEAIAKLDREQARRILFMSGHVAEVTCRSGVLPCLAKPFDKAAVRDAIGGFLPIRLHDPLSNRSSRS